MAAMGIETLHRLAESDGFAPAARLSRPERLKLHALSLAAASCRLLAGNGCDDDLRKAVRHAARAALLLGVAPSGERSTPRRDFPADLMSGAGMLADAAEKFDHLEEFAPIARAGAAVALDAAWAEAVRRGQT